MPRRDGRLPLVAVRLQGCQSLRAAGLRRGYNHWGLYDFATTVLSAASYERRALTSEDMVALARTISSDMAAGFADAKAHVERSLRETGEAIIRMHARCPTDRVPSPAGTCQAAGPGACVATTSGPRALRRLLNDSTRDRLRCQA